MFDVSVIIPCYNAENTIERCIDSVIESTKDIKVEIITIDDGSTDLTLKKLYNINKTKYLNMQIISTENNGVSHARNLGIKNSKSKYICFLDSDDFYEKNLLDSLLNIYKNNEVDLVCCSTANRINGVDSRKRLYKLNQNQFLDALLYDDFCQGFVWNKMYKKSIIDKNNIAFNEKIHVMEDLEFNLNYLQFSNDIIYLTESLYFYDINNNSTMFSGITDKKIDLLYNFDIFLNKKNIKNIKEKLSAHYVVYCLMLLSNIYKSNIQIPKVEKLISKILINNKRNFLKYSKKYKIKFFIGGRIYYFSPFIYKKMVQRWK